MVKVVKSTILEAPVDTVWGILRDFNGHDRWHPAVADSVVERGLPSDKVGCVRRFHLAEHVRVTGAEHENGMLHIDLVREVPEALKPRRIEIASSRDLEGKAIEAETAA